MENSAAAPRALYVGGLPKDLENPEDVLLNLFSKVGMILSVRICRDINTSTSLGYAYVNFQSPQDAERAQQQLNYSELPNRPGREIRVLWSSRDPTVRKRGAGNLFVKNINPDISNKQLHELFSQYGPVLCATHRLDDSTGTRRGYGFVHMATEEDATRALKELHDKDFAGQPLHVEMFVKRVEREKEAEKTFQKIYLKNIRPTATEEDLEKVFKPFGGFSAIFLTKHPSFGTKYALIDMNTHEGAVEAIEKLDGAKNEIADSDAGLFACRCKKKADRKQATSALYQSEGRNLYVKHLPDDMTEERFRAEFSPFGEIESVALMKTADGIFRGVAFVTFKTKEAADAAVRQLHGKMVYGRPLYVALAQRRDARHKMLEDQTRSFMVDQMRMPNYNMMMAPWGNNMFPPMMRMPPMHVQQPPFAGRPLQRNVMHRPMNPAMMPPRKMMPPQNRGAFPPQRPPMNPRDNGNVTANMLANMSPEERKNAMGERLYAQIAHIDANQAAKITGMLLEMEVPEILDVLENPTSLRSKVQEAQHVLLQHEASH